MFTYWLLGKSNSNITDHTLSTDEQSLASRNSRAKTEDTGLGSATTSKTSKESLKDTAKSSEERASQSSRAFKASNCDEQVDEGTKKGYSAAKAARKQVIRKMPFHFTMYTFADATN